MTESNQLEILDILTVLSFVLQIQNQSHLIDITDVQAEVNRAVGEIHEHLERQDEKISVLLERTENNENYQMPV